jgi:hypothetical protein
MKRYFLTNKLEVAETVRRAIECGVLEIHIIDCSGTAVGFWIDMDLAGILDEQDENYVTRFAK